VLGSGWARMACIWVGVSGSLVSSGILNCLRLVAGLWGRCLSWCAHWKSACMVRIRMLMVAGDSPILLVFSLAWVGWLAYGLCSCWQWLMYSRSMSVVMF
jgi:hypothetical protein